MILGLISCLLFSFGLAYVGLRLRDDIIELRRSNWRKKERDRRDRLGLCYDCGKPLDNQMFLCDKSNPC